MTIYKRGLLIGRFQPFHKGHLYLVKHVIKKVQKLIIAIGSANIYDEANPLTYEERRKILEQVIHTEKLDNNIEKIIFLNDYYDDELWFKNVMHKTGPVDIVIGNNEWTNRIFETRGYKIWRVGFFKKYLYEGEKIRTLIRNKKSWSARVPDYLFSIIDHSFKHHAETPYRFQHIALGGTFDHFHKGHRKLIDTGLTYGRKLSIGITTSEMYFNKKLAHSIESYQQRKKSVLDYLEKKKAAQRAEIFKLPDIYGSTKKDGTIESIVVSKSTYPNAIRLNAIREKNNLPELKIICIKDVKGNDGRLISSERIRNGEIDREGNHYFFLFKKTLLLPEYLRPVLKKPLGKMIEGEENKLEKTAQKVLRLIKFTKPTIIISVGDIITMSLEKIRFIPDVKIIDYRSRRHAIYKVRPLEEVSFKNKPGTISRESAYAIQRIIKIILEKKIKQKIIINGEEDLLALPAILFAPLGSLVMYGQIDLGIVTVFVDEKKKNMIKKILEKFKVI